MLSENQREITCLRNIWFRSCRREPMGSHLSKFDLIEGGQRGAKKNVVAHQII